MSAQLRQCRQGLVKALDEATNHLPDINYCSATISGAGHILYISCPLPTQHHEMFQDLCLALTAHNHVLTQHGTDCRCVCCRFDD